MKFSAKWILISEFPFYWLILLYLRAVSLFAEGT